MIMKSIVKYLLSSLSVLSLLTACEMDQVSPTNIGVDESSSSIQDAESWRMGLYATMRSAYSPGFLYTSDVQLDNFVLTTGDGNANGLTANWTFQNEDTDSQTAVWANNYSVIKAANKVIENMRLLPTRAELSKADSVEWEQIMGEAFLARAIAYQSLAVFFTDRYDAEGDNAKSQLGLLLYDKVDVDSTPARESLDSTYKFMLADCDSADKYMTDPDPGNYLRNADIEGNLLNRYVLGLVKARIFLNKGDYAKAAETAETLIEEAASVYPLITTAEGLSHMWENDEGSEILFQLFQSKDELAASWSVFTGYNTSLSEALGSPAYTPSIQPSAEALKIFSSDLSDIRRTTSIGRRWSYYAYAETGSINNGYVNLLVKYPGNPDLQTSVSDCYNNVKLFRMPEAYLIAAEANYRLGNTDKAIDYYNRLHHDARGASLLSESMFLRTDFITLIGDEYVREYIGEGLVFSAYKRLNRNVVRAATGQPAGTASSFAGISVTPDDPQLWKRWTWEIPEQDLSANTQIESNWN